MSEEMMLLTLEAGGKIGFESGKNNNNNNHYYYYKIKLTKQNPNQTKQKECTNTRQRHKKSLGYVWLHTSFILREGSI